MAQQWKNGYYPSGHVLYATKTYTYVLHKLLAKFMWTRAYNVHFLLYLTSLAYTVVMFSLSRLWFYKLLGQALSTR